MRKVVETSLAGGVATVTLNRPAKMNALNLEMWQSLARAMDELGADATLRCIILRGAEGNFAAGADLAEFRAQRWAADQAEDYGAIMMRALYAIRDCPQPTVAAIEGNCIGAGLEVAAMCDLRLATSQARFGVPIQKIGVTMPYPELSELVTLLGRATMLELLLEGGIHDADWAFARGLVTRISAVSDFEQDLTELVRKIASGSPLSHRNHKMMTRRCQGDVKLEAAEIRAAYAACESIDYREGIEAFLAKRRPVFQGN
ncbi:MAG TPA: enoyl-CoA hydratase/isomerase family protein [Terriglobia bacterium]|nr:enoyl-CoA hydratase/isomerase family protein [Terriglobia bacterium]